MHLINIFVSDFQNKSSDVVFYIVKKKQRAKNTHGAPCIGKEDEIDADVQDVKRLCCFPLDWIQKLLF